MSDGRRSLIASLILDRPLCLACVAIKANLTLTTAADALTEIGKSLQLSAVPRSRCRNCGDIVMTYSIGERLET